MAGIKKPKWDKNRYGIKVLRIRGLNESIRCEEPKKTAPENGASTPAWTSTIQRANGEMFAGTELPEVPSLSDELLCVLDELRDKAPPTKKVQHKAISRGKVKSKKFATKLNGFVAFRSFHAREISTTGAQRYISSKLAKAWADDPKAQLIWERYATEYNAQPLEKKQSSGFVDWLLNVLADGNVPEAKGTTGTHNFRIQDVYTGEHGDFHETERKSTTNILEERGDPTWANLRFQSEIIQNSDFAIDPLIKNA